MGEVDAILAQDLARFERGVARLCPAAVGHQGRFDALVSFAFNVVSSGTDHQFNLPTASATTRGALSTTDWSAFNGKQAALVSGANIGNCGASSYADQTWRH